MRHSTSLYAVKMTESQLSEIGQKVLMKVWVQACCDNYDRIGNINLALVPKGSEKYNPDEVQRIELGRFITPFMNKNKQPDTVPYVFNVSYLSYILRDKNLREQYDLWMEYELFGVPYAANKQVKGCEGRSDVFKGTLKLETSVPALPLTTDEVLVPIVMKQPEYKSGNLNNYSEAGTDTIGKTTKTYTFEVPADVAEAQIVLVTSNHGANSGGEEYNRRWHYVYYDGEVVLSYMPGRTSCEPFRKYNTQANGIYGYSAKSDAAWQSFSNWCPGDVIDNRIISLGAVKAGTHKVMITVPDAEFRDKQGYIPVSMFFQGVNSGSLSSVDSAVKAEPKAKVSVAGGKLSVSTSDDVYVIELVNMQGQTMAASYNNATLQLPACPAGVYLVNVELSSGIIETHKVSVK